MSALNQFPPIGDTQDPRQAAFDTRISSWSQEVEKSRIPKIQEQADPNQARLFWDLEPVPHHRMQWPSKPNISLLHCNLRGDSADDGGAGGKVYPGIAEWLYDHYVCILPSPSNCVGILAEKHCDKIDQLLALVRDDSSSQRPAPGPKDTLPVTIPADTVHELTLLQPDDRGASQNGTRSQWRLRWSNIFTASLPSQASSDRVTDTYRARAYYIRKCRINYLRSFEYDQSIRGYRSVKEGREEIADFPKMDSFHPEPFAPIIETYLEHNTAMMGIDHCKWFSPENCEQRKPKNSEDPEALRVRAAIDFSGLAVTVMTQDYADFKNAKVKTDKEWYSYRRCDKLRDRMLKYPVEGKLDGAVTIAIPGFLSAFEAAVGSVVPEISAWFGFFKSEDDPDSSLFQDALHLPILLTDHQHDQTDLKDATINGQRLACASAATFLAALGIEDFPVYGLATYGHRGVISQAWYSNADNCCYAMDGVTSTYQFDISKKEGILHFANFLEKLKKHAQDLRARFDKIQADLLNPSRAHDGARFWTFGSQLNEYNLWQQGEETDGETGVDSYSDTEVYV